MSDFLVVVRRREFAVRYDGLSLSNRTGILRPWTAAHAALPSGGELDGRRLPAEAPGGGAARRYL